MKGMKTGGREAGTPNKVKATLQELVEAETGAPLPVLLARIGKTAFDHQDLQLAVAAFSKAATFIYPRLQAIDPPQEQKVVPPVVIRFSDPEPCSSCGHDASKNTRVILPT